MPRSATDTKERILAAARAQFAEVGFERTTMRSVATAAGIDVALVARYFDNKAGLFAAAAELDLGLPDLSDVPPARIGDVLVDRFLAVWESDLTFLALLRAAASSDVAAARMRELFAEQVLPALAARAVDQPEVRAAMVGSQVLGFAFARYVAQAPPLVAMTRDDVRAWLGPALARFLTAPLPG